MLCPSCKGENRAGRRICLHCGTGLELASPSCGASAEPRGPRDLPGAWRFSREGDPLLAATVKRVTQTWGRRQPTEHTRRPHAPKDVGTTDHAHEDCP
jgi:hypothetical protein